MLVKSQMVETEEIAKAIQESAKLGQTGLELAGKMASFFCKGVQGTRPRNSRNGHR